jgi:hypothetical protein
MEEIMEKTLKAVLTIAFITTSVSLNAVNFRGIDNDIECYLNDVFVFNGFRPEKATALWNSYAGKNGMSTWLQERDAKDIKNTWAKIAQKITKHADLLKQDPTALPAIIEKETIKALAQNDESSEDSDEKTSKGKNSSDDKKSAKKDSEETYEKYIELFPRISNFLANLEQKYPKKSVVKTSKKTISKDTDEKSTKKPNTKKTDTTEIIRIEEKK